MACYQLGLLLVLTWGAALLQTTAVAGQTCEAFAGQPPQCVPFVDYEVFIPAGFTQQQLAALIEEPARQTQLAPPSCGIPALGVLCGETFRNCTETQVGPLGRSVCRSACEDWMDNCRELMILAGQGDLVVNCTTATTQVGNQSFVRFPADGEPLVYEFPVNENLTIFEAVACFSPVYDPSVAIPLGCPPHFSRVKDPKEGEIPCAPSCPYETWSEARYEAWIIVEAIIGFASILVTGAVLVPWLLDKKRMRFPQMMPAMQLIHILAQDFTLVFPALYGYKDLVCEDATTPAGQSHAGCAFSGMVFYVTALSGYMWWTAQCLYLVLSTFPQFQENVMGRRRNRIVLQVLIHVACWGYPIVPFIVVASNEKFGAALPNTRCTVDGESDNGWWIYGAFLLMIQIPVAASTIFLIILFVRIAMRIQWAMLRTEIRLIVFAVYYLVAFWILLLYNWLIRGYYDDIVQGAEDWYRCLAEDFYLNGGNGAHCELENQPPEALDWTIRLFTTLPLFFVPFILGVTWSTYYWYKNLLVGAFVHKKLVLSSEPTVGLSSTSSNSSRAQQKVAGKKLDMSAEMSELSSENDVVSERSESSSSDSEPETSDAAEEDDEQRAGREL